RESPPTDRPPASRGARAGAGAPTEPAAVRPPRHRGGRPMSREWEKAYHWFSREAVPAFGLTPPQIAVYNALRDRADDDGETFPSQETIGRESGIGPRAVRAAVARLVDLGLVEIVRRGRRGGIRYRI